MLRRCRDEGAGEDRDNHSCDAGQGSTKSVTMKVLTTLAVLSLLVHSGCCLNADNCTDEWVQDGGVDAPVMLDGAGDVRVVDGPNMSMPDGGGDMGPLDAMVDAYVPDAMPECASSMSCSKVDKPFCDTTLDYGTCRECRLDVECAGRAGKLKCNSADPLKGQCGECNVSADCGDAAKPVCQAHVCRPCVQDSECSGPGICLDHLGGRCAKEEEVLYVEAKIGCGGTIGEKGTKQNPFCSPADAIAESIAASTRRVIVLGGTKDLASFKVSLAAGESLTIIGKGPAIVDGAGRPGVELVSGSLYLRGVTVKNGFAKAGIVADGESSMLYLLRSVVQDNADGGIIISNKAAFTIRDTLVTGNGTANSSLTSGIFVGGDQIQVSKRVLQNVSVINNKGIVPEVTCLSQITASGLLAFRSLVEQISDPCVVANCCAKPKFNAAFKLQNSSEPACFDKVPASQNTLDVFGQLRLDVGDCGADELDLP